MSNLSELPAAVRVDAQPGPATIALDDAGLIQACSASCEKLFGYPAAVLLGQHVSLLLPKLEDIALIVSNDINPRLKHLCHCAIPFLARRRDGRVFASEVFFNRLYSSKPALRVIVRRLGMTPP